jgi:dolichol kinase
MHLSRKLFHATGIVVVVIYAGVPVSRPVAASLLAAIAILEGCVDLLRSRVPAVQRLFQKWFAALLDPKDTRGFNSSTLYFAGCALAVALFPRPHACAGILALALGDPSAAIVGSSVRSPSWNKVSVAGCAACLVAATLGCRVFFGWPAALAGGVVAMVLEAVSGSKLDNLTMPLGTATVLYCLA